MYITFKRVKLRKNTLRKKDLVFKIIFNVVGFSNMHTYTFYEPIKTVFTTKRLTRMAVFMFDVTFAA